MDCIQVSCFCTFSQIEFSFGCTVLSIYTHFQVFLCAVGYNFTKQFSEFCCMFSFFVSSFFPVQTDFRISFSVSYTSHSQIHTDFRAFTFEVCSQISQNIFRNTFCYTYNMFSSPCFFSALLFELGSRCFTYRTDFRCSFSFINISTYSTNKFLHSVSLLFFFCSLS